MMVFMLTERVLVLITDSEIMFVIDLYFSMFYSFPHSFTIWFCSTMVIGKLCLLFVLNSQEVGHLVCCSVVQSGGRYV